MQQPRLAAVALLILAAACGDDRIPLGIEAVGPQAPGSGGPQGPRGPGPGRISSGGGAGDVAAVAIAPASLSLVVGDSARVFAAAVDANGQGLSDVAVTWASSDTRVVRVREVREESGVAMVIAAGAGTAVVSATAGSVSATALVLVSRR